METDSRKHNVTTLLKEGSDDFEHTASSQLQIFKSYRVNKVHTKPSDSVNCLCLYTVRLGLCLNDISVLIFFHVDSVFFFPSLH